jgi:hypothetical protein
MQLSVGCPLILPVERNDPTVVQFLWSAMAELAAAKCTLVLGLAFSLFSLLICDLHRLRGKTRTAGRRQPQTLFFNLIPNLGYFIDISDDMYHNPPMTSKAPTQQDRALALLKRRGIARISELTEGGVTRATVARMRDKGLILQLGRGLYQLPDGRTDAHHTLAEAAKRVPKGIVCLVSALAYHELTDTIPRSVWMAIGPKDWRPVVSQPPLQIVRFSGKLFSAGIEEHKIEGVTVRIYNPAKTIVDLFRYRQSAGRRYKTSPGLTIAHEGLREAQRHRKATPAKIAEYAAEAGIWKVVQPYLEAMTANA